MQGVRKFRFDVYGALGTGVFRIGLNLEGDKTRGLSLRRKTETYDIWKEWRNKGREMQFGIGYSIPWDVGRSGHSRYVHAMHHIDEWGHVHMVLVECPSGVASEAPCHSWTEKGSLGHNHMHKWLLLSGDGDGEGWKICLVAGRPQHWCPNALWNINCGCHIVGRFVEKA